MTLAEQAGGARLVDGGGLADWELALVSRAESGPETHRGTHDPAAERECLAELPIR